MEITFLGTGAGMPSKHRNTSSLIVSLRAQGEGYWMFDCGEATQHQLQYTAIKPGKINKVFITHVHGDHLFGLPGFLSSRSFLGGEEPLEIYAPKEVEAWLTATFACSNTHIPYPIHFYPIEQEGVIFESDQYRVIAKKLAHVVDSYGFRIEEAAFPGALDVTKAKALGVPNGPQLGQLKRGEDVTLSDGRVVKSHEVLGESVPGRTVTILGDTAYCEASVALAEQAELLIHEATFDDQTTSLAKDFGHSTIIDAATVASEAKVKHLICNHISARFLPEDVRRNEKVARELFSRTTIASDFTQLKLSKTGELAIEQLEV